jgi:hypothetical protein
MKKAVKKKSKQKKWKYCMLVEGCWANVPGPKMWKWGVRWALKKWAKAPKFENV